MKNRPPALKALFSAIVVIIAITGSPSAWGGMVVYQLPDGSRILTDHAVNSSSYKLVRAANTHKKMGRLISRRHRYLLNTDVKAYDRLIRRTAILYRVDPALIKAIIRAESAFNPYARSHAGASGLMQLMPSTAEHYGVEDIYDPQQNIRAGVRHIKYLMRKYKYNVRLAVAAYNAGEKAVRRYKGIPPYKETRKYVKKVLRYHRFYRSL